jgi:hypothetical protein
MLNGIVKTVTRRVGLKSMAHVFSFGASRVELWNGTAVFDIKNQLHLKAGSQEEG